MQFSIHAGGVFVYRIKHELRTIDINNIDELEQMLKKYREILHENHSICLEIKYGLSQLYGKMSAYIINEMPNHLLERKRDICLNLLTVFDIIDPGLSRLRGKYPSKNQFDGKLKAIRR